MDVRGGESQQSADSKTGGQAVSGRTLDRAERCDVVVIGAGATGALLAHSLAAAGLDVIIVEQRAAPARGSTAVSTALIQYDTDLPLIELEQRIGRTPARMTYRACRLALNDLDALVRREQIDCGFHWRPSLYLAGAEEASPDFMAGEAKARAELGIEVELLSRAVLLDRYGIDRVAAVRSQCAIEVDATNLTLELLNRAMRRGARLFEDVTVRVADESPSAVTLDAGAGHSIAAGHVVFATGYEVPEQFPSIRTLRRLSSTYAIAARPAGGAHTWPDRALLWEHAQPYLYARTTDDGGLMIGGEDEPFIDAQRRDALLPMKSRRLRQAFARLMPRCPVEIESSWCGTFASTEDSLALIGVADPRHPRCLFALGFGGNGMTFAVLASQILCDAIIGRPNEQAALFSFERFTGRARRE